VLLRNRAIVGVDWGAWAMSHPTDQAALLTTLLEMVGRGELRPVEPTTYPLEDAARALEDLAERRAAGKIALVP
jgi:NADPH2:quinone reductase